MRTIETTVYQFSELSEKAKDRAVDHFRGLDDLYSWSDDYRNSIAAFCDQFGIRLIDWNVGPWSPFSYATDATNAHFRGIKLASFDREQMPTGFCADCDLAYAFHDAFKQSGDALHAFKLALDAGFEAWRSDWESAYDTEQIIENIALNDYEFTEDGTLA